MESVDIIPKKVQKVWDAWDIRIFILLSLFSQIILVFLAPLRKRNARKRVNRIIWSAYLLAEWVAVFALGILTNSKDDCSSGSNEVKCQGDLLAFWAPFLLLHLGGPDNITAFALEDNELWFRHLLGLVYQLLPACYVLLRSSRNNNLLIPTVLMLLVGIIKYGERTKALYLASSEVFTDSVIPEPTDSSTSTHFMQVYGGMKEAGFPTDLDIVEQPERSMVSQDELVVDESISIDHLALKAHSLFLSFKGLVVNFTFTTAELIKSQNYFLRRSAEEAFKIMEMELNFMYETLYTKLLVVHSKEGYVLRIICIFSILLAYFLFFFAEKRRFREFDVTLTHILLLGALSLETISIVSFILSDWSGVTTLKNLRAASVISNIKKKYPILNGGPSWSQNVSQFNLISFCLNDRPTRLEKIAEFFCVREFLNEMNHKSRKPVTVKLQSLIFDELRAKCRLAKDSEAIKEINSSRGGWCISRTIYNRLLEWSCKGDFDESFLMWHIATEVVYQMEEETVRTGIDPTYCKLLSDYMLYLMVFQPSMTSSVGGTWKTRYRDTRNEAVSHLSKLPSSPSPYEYLLSLESQQSKLETNKDGGTTTLLRAIKLANDLQKLKQRRWKLIFQVLLEMLCFMASKCRGNAHAQQLSKGGELLTFIWLLMAHFGLGDNLSNSVREEFHLNRKIVVRK